MRFQIGDLNVYFKMLCVLWWIYELAIKLRISLSLIRCNCLFSAMTVWAHTLTMQIWWQFGSSALLDWMVQCAHHFWGCLELAHDDSCNKVKKNVNFQLAHYDSCKVGTSNVFAWKIDDVFVHHNSLRVWYDAPLVANVSLVMKPRRVGIIQACR